MNELIPYGDETNRKSAFDVKTLFSNVLSSETFLPILLLGLLGKSGHLSGKTEDIARSADMLRMSKPYFNQNHKDALSIAESVLDAMYSLNKLTKGEYKNEDSYVRSYQNVKDKPIKILQAVQPHMKGKSRETIDKVLTVEDRIKRLKDSNRQKNILEDFENLTDILEMIQKDKGGEVRSVLTKAKQMIEIMKH